MNLFEWLRIRSRYKEEVPDRTIKFSEWLERKEQTKSTHKHCTCAYSTECCFCNKTPNNH